MYYVYGVSGPSLLIDPLHVTSRGARSGPPWRTTGAVFYGENVQRLPLPLVCKEGKHPFFSWLQYVRLTTACFEISVSCLASMHIDRATAPFSAC